MDCFCVKKGWKSPVSPSATMEVVAPVDRCCSRGEVDEFRDSSDEDEDGNVRARRKGDSSSRVITRKLSSSRLAIPVTRSCSIAPTVSHSTHL